MDGLSLSERSDQASPYVSIYISRKQAEAVERVLQKAARSYAPSHVLQMALKHVRSALAENNGRSNV